MTLDSEIDASGYKSKYSVSGVLDLSMVGFLACRC